MVEIEKLIPKSTTFLWIIIFILLAGFIATLAASEIEINGYRKTYNDCMIALESKINPGMTDINYGTINITNIYK